MEVPHQLTGVTYENLWSDFDRNPFGKWLQPSPQWATNLANSNFQVFSARPHDRPLKFLYDGTPSFVPTSNVTFLPALPNLQTLTYEDIKIILNNFYNTWVKPFGRIFAIVSGDFQVWDRLFQLHRNNPEKYNWLIPVPGEWHWLWHILKGIYKMYYKTLLLPFSQILGYRSLDEKVLNFHYAEDLLQMVTIAIHKWIQESMQNSNLTVTQWLDRLQPNQPLYELVYACVFYFIPYWVTRAAIKWNKFADSLNWWRYWTHLFLAARKNNYCLMSIRFCMMLWSLHPDVRELYNNNRVISFSGDPGTGVPFDGICELVYISAYTMVI